MFNVKGMGLGNEAMEKNEIFDGGLDRDYYRDPFLQFLPTTGRLLDIYAEIFRCKRPPCLHRGRYPKEKRENLIPIPVGMAGFHM